jgi:mRNA interferase MazF
LKKPSMVLLEQMRTVNKSELQEYIGSIDDERIMRKIDNAMKKTLGLWHYKPVKTENIRCLCGKHLNDYLQDPDYFVERLDRFAKVRERCDKCDNFGWDYIVTEKKHK